MFNYDQVITGPICLLHFCGSEVFFIFFYSVNKRKKLLIILIFLGSSYVTDVEICLFVKVGCLPTPWIIKFKATTMVSVVVHFETLFLRQSHGYNVGCSMVIVVDPTKPRKIFLKCTLIGSCICVDNSKEFSNPEYCQIVSV